MNPAPGSLDPGLSLEPSGLPDGAEVLSRHRGRLVARVRGTGPDGAPRAVYAKYFAPPRLREVLPALLRGGPISSPAAAEAAAAERLRAAGVVAPGVLEVREERRGAWPGRSLLVLAEVPGIPLRRAFPKAGRARRALARALGDLCGRLRAAGLGHPDLHLGHLRAEGPLDAPRLSVLDVARSGPARDLAATLAALDASRPPDVSRTDRLRVLRGALGEARLGPSARPLARRVLGLAARGRRRLAARAPDEPLPEVLLDGGRLRASAGAVSALRESGLDTAASFLDPARGRLVRSRDGRENVQIPVAEGPEGPRETTWHVKRHRSRPLGERVRAALGLAPPGDPAAREWEMLRRCLLLGIPTPAPVAWGRVEAANGRGGSFVATAAVEGARPLDELLAEWRALPPAEARARRRAVAGSLAALVRRFHGAGLSHRDLYLCHVLAAPSPRPEALEGPDSAWAAPRLTLIDLARAERGAPFFGHRVVKDLAALEYSAAPLVPRAERLRWLRLYLGVPRGTPRLEPAARRIARAILAKAARIARHEGRAAARSG
ncbi:MAG: hypothetical protein L0216_00280 [Planctomycetales bacterium]|nr:hypothetical protein [Planctomycetales bacterium]